MIRILQKDNRLTKGLFALIIGAAIVTMVVTLVPGIFDTGTTNDAGVYAIVRSPGWFGRLAGDSKTIRTDQVARQAQGMLQQQHIPPQYMQMMMGMAMQQAGQSLVARAILVREADKLGLGVTDADVINFMKSGPFAAYIFPNGQFVGMDKYTDFVQSAFQMPREDFENEVKADLELQRLEAAVTGGLRVSDNAVREEYRKSGTKVKFDYAILKSDDLKKSINPSDADLEAFFKQNAPRYATAVPEQRRITFFNFDAASIPGGRPQVTDADVQAYYNSHQAQYKVDEQVQTRHILITVPRGADAKADADAKAKAQEALNAVKSGGNFADLAKKYSADPGSKDKGGELPLIPTAQLDPAYAKAAMALNPGQTSDLVRSQFGYHIIQTEKKEAAHVRPLAEVKDQIQPLLEQQKAGAAEQNFANQLAAEAKKNGMQKAADAHGMHLVTTDFLNRDGVIGTLPDSAPLLSQAFSATRGGDPAVASTGDGFAVFQVADIKPAHAPAFADFKPTLLTDYRDQKAPELLNQQLAKLDDRAKQLNDVKKAAAEFHAEVKTSDLVGQDAQVPDLGSMTGPGAPAFSLAKGAISGPINTGPNGVVLQVIDKQEPTADDIQKNFQATRDKLLSRQRQELFNVYAESLLTSYQKAGAIVTGKRPSNSPPTK